MPQTKDTASASCAGVTEQTEALNATLALVDAVANALPQSTTRDEVAKAFDALPRLRQHIRDAYATLALADQRGRREWERRVAAEGERDAWKRQASPASETATTAQDGYLITCPQCGQNVEGRTLRQQLIHLCDCADRVVGQWQRKYFGALEKANDEQSARSSSEPSVTTDAETDEELRAIDEKIALLERERPGSIILADYKFLRALARSARSPESSPAVDAGTTKAMRVALQRAILRVEHDAEQGATRSG